MNVFSGLFKWTGRVLQRGWLFWLAAPVLLWFSLRGVALQDIWGVLRGIQFWQYAVLFTLNLAILLFLALRWQMILRAIGERIPIASVLAYRLAGFGLSYITPGPQFGGEPLQVMLLHRRSAVPMASAVTSVVLEKIIELLANFSFLVFGICVASLNGLLPSGMKGIAWVGIAGIVVIPAAHLISLWKGLKPATSLAKWLRGWFAWPFVGVMERTISDAEEQIGTFCRERPFELGRLLMVSALVWLLSVCEFQWMVAVLGGGLSLVEVISLLTALRLAFMLPVPGGLGTMEAALVLAGQIVGLSPAIGLSAAVFIRARDLSLAFAGLWFGGWALKARQRLLENA